MNRLVKNTLILSFGAIIVKVLSGIYRIPLTMILGAKGIGIYELIYPLFALLLIIVSVGFPLGISKLISYEISQNNTKNIVVIYKSARRLLITTGIVLSILLVIISEYISILQGNNNLKYLYILLAPSVFMACLLALYRGYFQGLQNMKIITTSQIIEQSIKIVIGLILCFILRQYGLIFAVSVSY